VLNENIKYARYGHATDHEFDGALNELADFSASIHWFFAEIHIWLLSPQQT
jgi:hypothetical protein